MALPIAAAPGPDAVLVRLEVEAEARRVFAEFDSNIDRRIDTSELGKLPQQLFDVQTGRVNSELKPCCTGELLYALMVQRHGQEHVTMSPSALSYAATLWLQSGDTNQDGMLDVNEFVQL